MFFTQLAIISSIIKFRFLLLFSLGILSSLIHAQSDWYETESKHFKVLYRDSHSHLVPQIINSAENALAPLKEIFNFTPTEKIIINTYDAADFGFGAATTVPQNFIRLEIEPLETGYETVPFNDRIQWILSHELVHIVVNDHASDAESFFRSIFSKVAPEQSHPITVFYSLLTNLGRYTPRWHQEGIAVFIETWFSGGYGRMLGNFDEMYFRSMVAENSEFPDYLSLDTKISHNSFMLETSFYLYGTRFCAYLIMEYGPEKLLKWFSPNESDLFDSFITKFNSTYNIDFHQSWQEFIAYEKKFQKKNIEKLSKAKLTPIKYLSESLGWITQPYFSERDSSIIFGYHKPHHLAGIQKLFINDLSGKANQEQIASLPTPSIQQVASTAFDEKLNLFFYTTNNNQLYRDIWALDLSSGKSKMLFEDCRVGDLTVSPGTHELWGVQHDDAKATLVYSEYPYRSIEPVVQFTVGDEILQLAVDPSGKNLAAVLHRSSGNQSIIIADCDSLLSGGTFRYRTITSSGSPENPSWSPDGKFIFWNAYENGVSNIFRINLSDSKIEALSHSIRGLFKPIYLNEDSLFAFEFTSSGFIPVIIPNLPAEYLPAIEYFGQAIADKYDFLSDWALQPVSKEKIETDIISNEKPYSGLANLNIHSFVPVIAGFQNQKVLGLFTHIADPLLIHDLTIEIGYSPFNENPAGPKFHFKGRYEYRKKFDFGIDHNAPDFYDLFNDRKRGMIGTKFRLAHTHYWIFDNPLKMKQNTEIAIYTDFQYINDNLVRVSEPDFFVAQTNFNSKNLRRSIGSSDLENGNEFNTTVMVFGSDPDDPQYAAQVFSDWSFLSTYIAPHNVLHLKLGAGFHFNNENLYQAQFFFGGFGNRALENVESKQYRNLFRFPGIPIYSLSSEQFFKVLLENNFPPIRFSSANIGQQYLNHIDLAVYSQALITKSPAGKKWVDIGAQINLIFKHWFNLESTLSAGIASAWSEKERNWEWFVSYKLLKN